MSLDGEILWNQKRNPNFDRGGFLIADGKIFNVDGRRGGLYVVEASPKGFKQLARIDLLNRPNVWAPLALSDGRLVLRDQKQILCLKINAGESY